MSNTIRTNSVVTLTRFAGLRFRVINQLSAHRRPREGRLWVEEITDLPGDPTRLEARLDEMTEAVS